MQHFLTNILGVVLWIAFGLATYQFIYRFNILRNKDERVVFNRNVSLLLFIAMIILLIGGYLIARPYLLTGSAVALFVLMTCFALFFASIMAVSAYRADYRSERISDESAYV